MPRKFKRVLCKGYGYSKSKPNPVQQQSHQCTLQDEEGGLTKAMCDNSPEIATVG